MAASPTARPRKLLDVSRMADTGWRARIGFEKGNRLTHDWYRSQPA